MRSVRFYANFLDVDSKINILMKFTESSINNLIQNVQAYYKDP